MASIHPHKVFISHAVSGDFRDKQLAQFLNEGLKKNGIKTFLALENDSIRSGLQWELTLKEEISTCTHFLLILSRAAWESPEVQKEIAMAKDRRLKGEAIEILIIKTGGFELEGDDFLYKFQFVRFVNEHEKQLDELLKHFDLQIFKYSGERVFLSTSAYCLSIPVNIYSFLLFNRHPTVAIAGGPDIDIDRLNTLEGYLGNRITKRNWKKVKGVNAALKEATDWPSHGLVIQVNADDFSGHIAQNYLFAKMNLRAEKCNIILECNNLEIFEIWEKIKGFRATDKLDILLPETSAVIQPPNRAKMIWLLQQLFAGSSKNSMEGELKKHKKEWGGDDLEYLISVAQNYLNVPGSETAESNFMRNLSVDRFITAMQCSYSFSLSKQQLLASLSNLHGWNDVLFALYLLTQTPNADTLSFVESLPLDYQRCIGFLPDSDMVSNTYRVTDSIIKRFLMQSSTGNNHVVSFK